MRKKVKTPEQALSSLMKLCAKAERSSGDARRLMARWEVEPSRRDEMLEKLIKSRFIDDARYASAYVREKTNLAGWGAHKIRASLVAKGIARDTIEEALAQVAPEKAGDKLLELLRRKARTVRAVNNYELKNKLVRYGLSRGFDLEKVIDSVGRIVKTMEED